METIEDYKKEIDLLTKDLETLSGLCTKFAKRIGTERDRGNMYWKRAVEAERKLERKFYG